MISIIILIAFLFIIILVAGLVWAVMEDEKTEKKK
jgi:hypothetical protein